MGRPSIDIFCRVIDNFGDIGVCWRLARQLARSPDVKAVRLWVDDLHSFARIEPRLDCVAPAAVIEGVTIVHWAPSPPDLAPHDVVVEAFACDPPPGYIQRMIKQKSLWINLEYLSAEPWVESCHALPSLQANGLQKAFFFPGFTAATGGLLREPDLLPERDDWIARPALRGQLLRDIGLPAKHVEALLGNTRQVLLFAYPQAPAAGLLQALADDATPSVVLVPAGVCPDLPRGQHRSVYVHDMPFTDQAGFDRLLWSSDLNCVRGEDSLVRALWAGKPMLWHIYPQDDNAHLIKLDAWLAQSPFQPLTGELMRAWNGPDSLGCTALLSNALAPTHWAEWQAASAAWSRQLAKLPDLASTLIDFCLERVTE
ncbi:elongation factor P maturation arginine rhamnosyltransferase EarP [Pusillimonas sp. MFBS29]|uniref:elongation factor P maturation arginine rhamnosyltransferase EarP n=1 Tax=Pusillimonas sp. MFBS29 TaxID=2886690 RepID=UPI001D112BF2|nr:elongation factor P maturation arginine rhamnosyltransferase EarP [Pusillimonas sp. MFBS29]MCC2596493.1 elongation factor P maturation arginine rhamnosyltransferase EarP [Pusillimonas sp. MFBS29]